MGSDFMDRIIGQEELIWNHHNQNRSIVFWGCGNNAHIVGKLLEKKGIIPVAFCDNNSNMWGKCVDGIMVMSYEQIKEKYPNHCILITTAVGGAIAISKQLQEAGETCEAYHVEKPFKVDDEFLEYEYFLQHREAFETVYGMLADDLSKEVFAENINFRLSGDKMRLIKYVDGDTFFDDALFQASGRDSYVDVGAYTGDTLLRFYAFCAGKYDKMYAIEPDKENYQGLQSLVKMGRLDNVSTYNVGGWDCKDTLTFYTANNKNTRGFDSPNFFKGMEETVPSACGIGAEDFVEEQIAVDTVDHLLDGNPCTVLKINALAADFEALRGSKATIKAYKPVIVGEFGARKENLTEMMLFIKECNPNYKLYMRQKMIFGDCKTVFTAVDDISKGENEDGCFGNYVDIQ